jgi:hypothetical protein
MLITKRDNRADLSDIFYIKLLIFEEGIKGVLTLQAISKQVSYGKNKLTVNRYKKNSEGD